MKNIVSSAFTVHQMANGNRKNNTQWLYPKTKKQPNSIDCGYYVMKNMLDIVSANITGSWMEVFNDLTELSSDELYELRTYFNILICRWDWLKLGAKMDFAILEKITDTFHFGFEMHPTWKPYFPLRLETRRGIPSLTTSMVFTSDLEPTWNVVFARSGIPNLH
ncbi:keratin, type II cytoskeletal 2 epidermal [Trifolium repens]|nr:keratin, type II cytoskeletal 2 epidermal [Trifolium repens]